MAAKNSQAPSSNLTPESLEYLSLNKQPFGDEILSDKSFFMNQALSKIIDSVIHQVQFSDLLLIIEGPLGAGKTALFRQFIQTDISNTKLLAIQAEATDTLQQIQAKMSLHLQDLGDANHLDDNLKSLQMFDQIPLIIMDNAHVLSDTTLQELLRYQQQLRQEHEVNLKFLFFANPGFAETLQKISDIPTEQMYVQAMPSYSPKQIDSFIQHRLRNAGYTGEPLLGNDDIQKLFKKSNGTVLNIMQQAAIMINRIVSHKKNPVVAGSMKTLWLAVLVLLLVAGGYAAYSLLTDSDTDDSSYQADTRDIHSMDVTKPEQPPQSNNLSQTEATTTQTPGTEDKPELYAEPAVSDTADTAPTADNHPTEDQLATSPETASLAAETQPDISPAITAARPDNTTTRLDNTDSDTEHTGHTTGHTPAATIEKPAAQAIESSIEPATEPTIEPHTAQAAPEPSPTIAAHPALKQLEILGIKDAHWLQQQPSTNWTLQFLGARGPETLLKFVRRHSPGAATAWYKTTLKGKPYYVLVYGSYPSRQSARDAITTLSPQLRAIKPWVKSIKSVQQALNPN